ncbi:MAG: substrate-binding domain-containing protein [Pseudomonadota bacterium]
MKKLFVKAFLTAAMTVLASTAYSDNTITINVTGVPYLHQVYKMLGDDFNSVEKRFLLKYIDENTNDFARKVASGSADFSVSDTAMSRMELDARGLIQFPAMVTAIVPVVNLPGIESDNLILDGPVLASIMSGEITKWNHESISALNPNLILPSTRIRPLARSEASGATLAITTYLAKKSSKFAKNVGVGESVIWPNEVQLLHGGVAIDMAMSKIPGTITYIEMDVGNTKQMKFVRLRHHTGPVVKADIGFLRSGVVSARATEGGAANSLNTVDFASNWPIVLPIYITLPKRAMSDEKTALALRFIYWTFHKGDDTIEQSGLVPLPVLLQALAVKVMRTVQSTNGGALTFNFDL